jgi:hypothetical protein
MAGGLKEDRERQPPGGEGRTQEADARSATVMRSLISAATIDRRTRRREELEREVKRLHQQRRRLEREQVLPSSGVVAQDVDRHLAEIESQLRMVVAERRRRMSDPADNRAPHDDSAELDRLKRETDRLTAELLRCAYTLSAGEPKKHPQLRRIWHMLRLSGS